MAQLDKLAWWNIVVAVLILKTLKSCTTVAGFGDMQLIRPRAHENLNLIYASTTALESIKCRLVVVPMAFPSAINHNDRVPKI